MKYSKELLFCCMLTVVTAVCGQEAKSIAGDRTYRVNGVSFTMKPIAAVQGAVLGNHRQYNNREHTVSLSAYYIGQTEVAQELWQAVMGNNPSRYTSFFRNSAKKPVECVNWFECIAFCNELTKKLNGGSDDECVYTDGRHLYTKDDAAAEKEPLMDMDRKGFRLPTEAEWEYAARGGTKCKYAGVDQESLLKNYAWYKDNAEDKTHEVATKKPNNYGLYDMSGNVTEWCWDRYEHTPVGGHDPTGPASVDSGRIRRGGSLYTGAYSTEVSQRDGNGPGGADRIQGLRLVCRP